MPYIRTSDGIDLFYEENGGSGPPIVFVHEFAGSYESWDPQVQYFSRRYRCVTYNGRGYPPSTVPCNKEMYSQTRAAEDVGEVVQQLGLEPVHLVGLSMGSFACLHRALSKGSSVRSLVLAGCGYGADPRVRETFLKEEEELAQMFEEKGQAKAGWEYAHAAPRLPFKAKDPKGWRMFCERFQAGSALGSALTLRGVQMRRPSLWDMKEDLKKLDVPTLVLVGDEDDPCIEASLFLKRTIGSCSLTMLPNSGHTLNLEEPWLFNEFLEEFFVTVENVGNPDER